MNLQDFFNATEEQQKKLLNEWHYDQSLSVHDIAKMLNTYTNKIMRLAKKIGFVLRNKKEAQKIVFATGKREHPTKGKKRSDSVKEKIGQGISDKWHSLSDEEKEKRIEKHKEAWNNRSDIDVADFRHKAAQARLKTSKHGSKLENIILTYLGELGYNARFHVADILLNERLHIDIYVPDIRTAIEIDGPSHFSAIWGEDKLAQKQDSDKRKNGLLLSSKINIIRIQQHKNLTKKSISHFKNELKRILDTVQNNTTAEQFIIGDLND